MMARHPPRERLSPRERGSGDLRCSGAVSARARVGPGRGGTPELAAAHWGGRLGGRLCSADSFVRPVLGSCVVPPHLRAAATALHAAPAAGAVSARVVEEPPAVVDA